jgi:hypothetical protein
MCQTVGELAVVHQKDQPARVGVQPSDGVEARAAVGHQLDHGRAPVCVARRGEDPDGLVDRKADSRLGPLERPTVDAHAAALVNVGGGVGHDAPPDAHAACGDHPLG